jgi:hypothetical protein
MLEHVDGNQTPLAEELWNEENPQPFVEPHKCADYLDGVEAELFYEDTEHKQTIAALLRSLEVPFLAGPKMPY